MNSKYDELASKATPRPWGIERHHTGYADVAATVEGDYGRDHHYTVLMSHSPRPSVDVRFATALANHADDFRALWVATKPHKHYSGDVASMSGGREVGYSGTKCPVCGEVNWNGYKCEPKHKPDCAHEALRPLFGEVDE